MNFVDGSQQEAVVDDRELIETEAQRKAIQQRWAMKRLAEADAQVKDKDRRTVMPDQDVVVERLMRDTNKYMGAPAQDAPPQAYKAAVRRVEAEQEAEVQVEQAEPAQEEIPQEAAPGNKKAEEKKEKLREILDQQTESQESRDLSRL